MKGKFNDYSKWRDRLLAQRAAKSLDDLAQEIIAKLHSEVFSHKYHTPCKGCSKSWIGYMDDLERWYQGNLHIFGSPPTNEHKKLIKGVERVIEVLDVKPKRIYKPMSEASKAKMRATMARKKKLRDTKVK